MVVVLVLGVLALGFLFTGAYTALAARKRATSGVAVTATVIDFSHYVSSGRPMYSPIFSAVVDGREVRGSTSLAKSWKSPPVGTQVRARFHPEEPDLPLSVPSFSDYVPSLVFFALGALFSTIVAVALLSPSKHAAGAAQTNANAPSAVPAAAPPSTTDGLAGMPVQAIQSVFRQNSAATKRCYDDALRRAGAKRVQGDVRIGMTLTREGQATDVRVESSTLGSPAVESCLVEKVRGWAFPPLPRATPFAWTFHFG